MTDRFAPRPNEFKNADREAECDKDEARWTERLKKVAH